MSIKEHKDNKDYLELSVRGRTLLRRRRDDYINATQILAIAGIHKDFRRRSLQSFLRYEMFELVEGGSECLTGTWVPLDVALRLATHHKVADAVNPLIVWTEADLLALQEAEHALMDVDLAYTLENVVPRYIKSYSSKSTSTEDLCGSEEFSSLQSLSKNFEYVTEAAVDAGTFNYDDDERIVQIAKYDPMVYVIPIGSKEMVRAKPETRRKLIEEEVTIDELYPKRHRHSTLSLDKRKRAIFENIYNSSSDSELLSLLTTKRTVNADFYIDDFGHTALHWAASLADAFKVKYLLSINATPAHLNSYGESVLMRTVASSHAFEQRSFFVLLGLLAPAIYLLDAKGNSLWHHIVQSFTLLNSREASVYYLECFCLWSDRMETDAFAKAFLNKIGFNGRSAVNVAYDMREVRVVSRLVSRGADTRSARSSPIKKSN